MTRGFRYVAGEAALLRMPVLPPERAAATRVDLGPDGEDDPSHLETFVREALTDPVLREAIEVSGGSLSLTLGRLERGDPVEPARLRRAAFAVARHLLRMTGRPTPFGLFAGVSVAGFAQTHDAVVRDTPGDDRTEVRLGTAHRKGVRVDGEWLAAVVARLEGVPAVLRLLRVIRNDLCFVRGDRLVLPYVRAEAGTAERPRARRAVHELSVRHAPPVRTALDLTGVPVPYTELLRKLEEAFPRASARTVETMLGRLISQEILLTDLAPPPSAPDPLEHVLRRLRGVDGRADPAVAEALAELEGVAAALADYAEQPLGAGGAAWREAVRRMRRIHVTERPPVQVDLRLDADVRLPRAIAEEVERVADALWRLSPPDDTPPHLCDYHAAFLERYGTARLVPIRELIDPERGLGAPAGYQVPPSRREQGAGRDRVRAEGERDELLAALAQEATLTGTEVVLDDSLIDRLAGAAGTHWLAGAAGTSTEFGVHVLAESLKDIERGDFRLVAAPVAGHAAGAVYGRFAYLFDASSGPSDPLGPVVAADGEELAAQLVFRPVSDREVNVLRVPVFCAAEVAVGVFAERGDPGVLGLDDVMVGADRRDLFLVAAGRRLTTFSPHMLNTRFATPNAVRLIREIAGGGGLRSPWSWGSLSVLPYLPRVRYGRTVISSARWRPTDELFKAAEPDRALDAWRLRWRVPDVVHVTYADHRIELDLSVSLHRRLLRQELTRNPGVRLVEPPGDPQELGWLEGRSHELVVPLVRRADRAEAPAPRHADDGHNGAGRNGTGRNSAGHNGAGHNGAGRSVPRAAVTVRHLPGGEWLYAKLYSGAELHEELLARHVPALLSEFFAISDPAEPSAAPAPVGGVWYFVRYADPEPQLRLRFHGDPGALHGRLLPIIHDWAGSLCTAGLARRLVLDTFEPELARYGGAAAASAAAEAFRADSDAVLVALRLRYDGVLDLPDELLAAAGQLDLVRAFGHDPGWVPAAFSKDDGHAAFQRMRREAIRLIDPSGAHEGLRAVPGGRDLVAAWRGRRDAVAAYGRLVRRLAEAGRLPVPPESILLSLLHMHHNRLLGPDRDKERRCSAVLRGAVQAHLDRARFGS
ncbi:lantibiotic dehydratase [Actinomadura sp. 9N215]|uniref:lantibiotic dehydratase n=1 Tax=Actinomadura sp. 9N215 TaxID=3375150 RepID=UPI003799D2AA